MKNIIALLVLTLACFAQNTPPPNPSTSAPIFTLQAGIMSVPGNGQTVAATDVGATFAVNKGRTFYLRSDNILVPADNLNVYAGGLQGPVPYLGSALKNTNLDPNHFQFYWCASAGQARITVGQNPEKDHFAALLGGGVNYDPAGTGKFSINLAEIRWAKLPGLSNSTVVLSSTLKLGW